MPPLVSSKDTDSGGTAVLLLIGIFAILAVGVLSYGVAVYRHLTDISEETFFQRTALSYFANQIRTFDESGSVSLGQWNGVDAIILREEQEGNTYVTYLYFYDGAIRQLAMQEGTQLTPTNGDILLTASGLSFSRTENSLCITAWDPQGNACSLTVTPRCGLEEVRLP